MSIILTANKDFLSNGVKIGDKVIAPSGYLKNMNNTPLEDFEIIVTNVNEDSLIADVYKNGILLVVGTDYKVTNSAGTYAFKAVRSMSKDQQVEHIAAIARSYASKRTLLIWPPKAEWLDADGNTLELDGTALAAAVASAMSAYPAQQSFTNLPFTGPHKLLYSNKYFTPAQLNVLSEAGVFVITQEAEGGNVVCRHQKTTSTASIQEAEASITKAVDKLSIDLKALFQPFIGRYNITPELLTGLREVAEQYLFNAQNIKAQYCGSLILGYKNLVFRANLNGENQDLTPGTVAVSLEVEVGYPANYIPVTVFVR